MSTVFLIKTLRLKLNDFSLRVSFITSMYAIKLKLNNE